MSRNLNGTTDELLFAVGTNGLVGMTHGTYAAIARVEDTAVFRTLFCFNTTGGVFVATPMQISDTDQLTWDGDAGVSIPMNTWLCIVVRKNTGTVLPRFSVFRYDTGAWTHTNGPSTHANHTALTTGHEIALHTTGGTELFDGDVALMAAWENHLPWAANATGDAALEQAGLQWDLLAWLNSYGHRPDISFVGAGAGSITITSGGALTPANPAGVAAGDLLIAHVFYGGSTAAPDTPTDWSLLDGPRSLNTPATNGRVWTFGKKAVGGDANPAFGTQAVTTPRRARVYAWRGVRDDTVANMVGGFAFDGPASSATINDVGVTTPEDRCVAVNLIAVADDNAVVSFTGETGGDWTEAVAEFTSTSGTPDTCMQLQTAAMPTAGTVNGGSQTMAAADPWGVVGFYIRPAIAGVAANPPNWLVVLDQSAVSQNIVDITGLGGNQSGITGTTVATTEPPGFGYGADPIVSPGHAGAAGAVALDGVLNAVAEHAGALSLALSLDGVSNAVAEHSALLSLALPLAGVSSAVAEHAGVLGLAVPLAGVSEIVAEHAGALSLAVGLLGVSNAVAEHSGTAQLAIGLLGVSDAVAEHSGALSLALPLVGVSNAVAEHAGAIGLTFALTGSSDAVAEHSGQLGLSFALQGTLEAVAEHTADLTLQGQVQLDGVVGVVAEHSGQLSLAVALTGVSDTVVEHTGALELLKFLDGASLVVAEHSGSLSLGLPLVGASDSVAEHSGTVSLQVGLTGVSNTVVELIGTLTTGSQIALDGVLNAVVEMTGSLELIPAVFSGIHLGDGYGTTADLGSGGTDPRYGPTSGTETRLLPGLTRSHLGRRGSAPSHLGGGS